MPPGGGTNLLSDPGFESGVDGFRVWPAGTTPSLTAKAIDGGSSLELVLPAGGSAYASITPHGSGAAHATAKLRNDGTTAADVKMCVGVYNQAWSSVYACTAFTLAPGTVTPASAEYVLPAGTTALMTNWFFENTGPATEIAVDDAYLGYASE